MSKNCYIYVRVSEMQVDSSSLEAQETKCRAVAKKEDYNVVEVYKDCGKGTEERDSFKKMLEDIKSHKDNVSRVFIYKLSRLSRNAKEIGESVQILKDNGCELICVEDGLDTSKNMELIKAFVAMMEQ